MGYCCRIFTPVQPVYPAASRGIFSLVLSGPSWLTKDKGDPRPSDRAALTVAELLRRASYRIHPTRMSRPPGGVRRSALASRSEELRLLLQPGPDASLTGEECAGLATPAEARLHRSHLNFSRTASSVCQDLGFDQGQPIPND
jgi:hypothetical protein